MRMKVATRMAAIVIVPTIPVLIWWKLAIDNRKKRAEQVRTIIRVPNVQTVDDLLVEKCRPGDVILFDRRWDTCAAGPLAALSCLLARGILCRNDDTQTRSIETGKFDHCGEFLCIIMLLCCVVMCCDVLQYRIVSNLEC